MSKFVSITIAADALGVSASTLRRWDAAGKLVPIRTEGGQRRDDLAAMDPGRYRSSSLLRRTVSYAHVSSHEQKRDLERQQQLLELYCAAQGWAFGIIADVGSGMNYHKKGPKKLLGDILDGNIGRLVVVHQDRLLGFGAELVFSRCQVKEVEVVIINQGEDHSFEEDLASDVLETVTVFSARLNGTRSHKNKKLIDGVKAAVKDAQC